MKKHVVAIFLFAASLSVSSACKTHQNMPFWTKLALGKIGADYGDSVRKYLIGNKTQHFRIKSLSELKSFLDKYKG